LEDVADLRFTTSGSGTVEGNRALEVGIESGDEVEQGGFSATGRAEDAEEFPGIYGKTHVLQHGDLSVFFKGTEALSVDVHL